MSSRKIDSHVNDAILRASIATIDAAARAVRARMAAADELRHRERGEGVISAAIAVLIMAVIGAAMFVAYKALFEKTSTSVSSNVDKISG